MRLSFVPFAVAALALAAAWLPCQGAAYAGSPSGGVRFMDKSEVDKLLNIPSDDSSASKSHPTANPELLPADLSRNISLLKGILVVDAGSGKVRTRAFIKLRVIDDTAEVVLPNGTTIRENLSDIRRLIRFMPSWNDTQASADIDKFPSRYDMALPRNVAEDEDLDAAKAFVADMRRIEERFHDSAAETFTAIRQAVDVVVMRYESGYRFYNSKWMLTSDYIRERNREMGFMSVD